LEPLLSSFAIDDAAFDFKFTELSFIFSDYFSSSKSMRDSKDTFWLFILILLLVD
jgi:hypothetical protein